MQQYGQQLLVLVLRLDRKRSGSEAITLRVTLEDVESLLLEVELVARLPISGQKWT